MSLKDNAALVTFFFDETGDSVYTCRICQKIVFAWVSEYGRNSTDDLTAHLLVFHTEADRQNFLRIAR